MYDSFDLGSCCEEYFREEEEIEDSVVIFLDKVVDIVIIPRRKLPCASFIGVEVCLYSELPVEVWRDARTEKYYGILMSSL